MAAALVHDDNIRVVEKRTVECRNNYSWKSNFFKTGFLVLCFSKSRAIYSFLRFFWPYSFVFGGWTRRIIFFRKHGNAWFLLMSSSQLRLVMVFLAFLWGIVAFLSILLRFKWFVTPPFRFFTFGAKSTWMYFAWNSHINAEGPCFSPRWCTDGVERYARNKQKN